jgi:hypothetical protein
MISMSEEQDDIEVYRAKLEDFTPLPDNPNAGTERGSYMTRRSAEKLGSGRSLVADKNGVINAGNHMQEAFVDVGIDDVIVVKTKGDQVVIHQREDWDVTENDGDNAAMEYAFVDNRVSEVGFALDENVFNSSNLDLGDWYQKEKEESGDKIEIDEEYLILIEFDSEREQLEALQSLTKEGFKCRSLIS